MSERLSEINMEGFQRILVVSDNLPFYAVRDNPCTLERPSSTGHDALTVRRKTRNLSLSMISESLSSLQLAPSQGSITSASAESMGNFNFVDRHSHPAHWVSSASTNLETIHLGKLAGMPAEGHTCRPLQDKLRVQCWEEKHSIPIFVDEETRRGHWDGYCRCCLWPLLHYVLWENNLQAQRWSEGWEAYTRLNAQFCDAIVSIWRPGDLVWVLDYQLLLLPAMLRAAVDDMSIAIYIRSPFPSSELFRCLPQAKEVLSGILGANLVGFQTYGYARHFLSSCTRILGCETTPKEVDNMGMPVSVVVHPVGIDPAWPHHAIKFSSVESRITSLRETFLGRRVILGIESLDQNRGILHKLQAFEKFLKMYQGHVGQVVLVQVIFAGTDPKKKMDGKISALVSSINGQFGTLDYSPVHIFNQVVENEEYLALLSIADMLLVTSERDSVSTMVLDFIMCQAEGSFGIPIISEFIGLASFLPTYIQINPWDHSGTARMIERYLSMSQEERRSVLKELEKFVKGNTVQNWVSFFLEASVNSLKVLGVFQPTPFLSLDTVLESYVGAESRMIFLDYDGTLTPIRRVPSAASPSAGVIRALRLLTADPRNIVYIISGRDQGTLEKWLGNIPRLGMSAEHGCFLRPIMEPGETPRWIATVNVEELLWMQDVTTLMEYYTERTPGSFIEVKSASITWHYRLSDPEFGSWQAKELFNHLDQTVASKYPAEVIAGKKNLEVRPKTCNKGEIVRMLLSRHGRPQFLLCAGDDKTDEDMFRTLLEEFPNAAASPGKSAEAQGRCFTCSVGGTAKKTLAKYQVNTPEHIVSLLMRLCTLSSERISAVTL